MFSFLSPVTHFPLNADVYLAQGVSYIRFLMTVFPPLDLMWQALLIVLGFKVTLWLLQVFRIIPT